MSTRVASWVSRLVDSGLSESERDAKTALFERALAPLAQAGDEVRAWWVPGRLEFLGKHTDYAGGWSLLCALERGFAVIATPRADTRVTITDAATGERVEASLDPELIVREDHWANYPMTVVRRVARNFPGVHRGADIAFASDLPPAAGLSSSSALIVATFLALAEVNDLESRAEYRASIRDGDELAGYLGAIENGSGYGALAGDAGVGTLGGSEDHVAILRARPGALVEYSFAPIHFRRTVPLPDDYVFVIASSGVLAEKTGNARELYNQSARLAAEALRIWREMTGSEVASLAAAIAEQHERGVPIFEVLRARDSSLGSRATHLDVESQTVELASDALLEKDLFRVGELVDNSQLGARLLLRNLVPETIALAERARQIGAVAASAFGAGFGGSVYALVSRWEAEAFRRHWARRYRYEFPHRAASATFFTSAAGPAALSLHG